MPDQISVVIKEGDSIHNFSPVIVMLILATLLLNHFSFYTSECGWESYRERVKKVMY